MQKICWACFLRSIMLVSHCAGGNKAFAAEHSIFLIKRRLYTLLRSKWVKIYIIKIINVFLQFPPLIRLTKAWIKYLKPVVSAINRTERKSLGYIAPITVKSRWSDIIIRSKIGTPKHLSHKQKIMNQKKYERQRSKLQVGSFVTVATSSQGAMEKSYDIQVISSNLSFQPIKYRYTNPSFQ